MYIQYKGAAMIENRNLIKSGVVLLDPIGRKLSVRDVFVPKNQRDKGASLPAGFRQIGRKVIVFSSGAVSYLADVEKRYSLAS